MTYSNDLFVKLEEIVYPGIQLAKSDLFKNGNNTFEEDGYIYSTVKGNVQIINDNEIIVVSTNVQIHSHVIKNNDIVYCRVYKLMLDQAFVKILSINDIPSSYHFDGKIQRIELRNKEVDKYRMDECMEVNDIILAKVLNSSDSRYINLTIADKHLGVVFSFGKNKNLLKYKNDEEMIDEITNQIIKKKIALK